MGRTTDGDIVQLRLGDPRAVWTRRFVAALDRAREAEQLYREMGFEVRIEHLRRDELDPRCGACADTACASYVVIYTRKPTRIGP